MSEKLVRFKYKKDIINCIEESWDYYGEEDEKRKVIKELKNVYKIAMHLGYSDETNRLRREFNEVVIKAQAFDEIKKHYNNCCYTNEINGFPYINESNFRELCEVVFESYERGDSDEL